MNREDRDDGSMLKLALQEVGLGRMYDTLLEVGARTIQDVENLTPETMQKIFPAVGSRRKLINLLTPGCPASGQTIVPFAFGTDHLSPQRSITRSATAQPMPSHAFSRSKRSSDRHAQPHDISRLSYLKGRKGTGTEFTTEVGGMARDVERTKRNGAGSAFKTSVLPAYRRVPSTSRSSATGEHYVPQRGMSVERRNSPQTTPLKRPTSARRRPSATRHLQLHDIPPPPPEEETREIHYRMRPTFIPRPEGELKSAKNDIFTFLTSRVVNLPADKSATIEKLLNDNEVSDVKTLRLLSDGDMEKLGIQLGHRRRIQAGFDSMHRL